MRAVKLDILAIAGLYFTHGLFYFLHAEITRNIKCSRLCIVCGATVEFICIDGRTDVTASVGGLPFF
jgi:hypothetical protein